MTVIADPNPSPMPPPPPRPMSLTLLLWTAKLVGAAILAYASFLKMTASPAEMRLFDRLGMEPVGRYLIGGLEGLAALSMVIPPSAVYAAFLGLGLMCGAVIAHVTVIGLAGVQYALLVMACCLTVLYLRRHDAPFLANLFDK